MTARHEELMREALELALRGWGRVSPNPLVGALVVRGDEVVGRGWYEGPRGSDHAEIRALREAGERAAGATVISTLEPCSHQGSTPPCTRALIAAGVTTVIAGTRDPNPVVDGRGIRQLRDAGIDVRVGVLEREARRLNRPFERHVTTGRPFVTLKMASSLDGKAAAADGSSRWITGDAARADVHRLRAGADAIVVGVGTALADDPALTVRDERFVGARAALRVVVDSGGRLEPTGRLFDPTAPTLVATTERTDPARVRAWRAAGADAVVLDQDGHGRVALRSLVDELGKRDAQWVLVEGGPTIAWSFLRDDLVDQVVMFLAPILVGGAGAPSAVMGAGIPSIDRAIRLEPTSIERVGDDLRVEADVHRDR